MLKSIFGVAMLAVLLAIWGCGTTNEQVNTDKAIKMQRSSGKMNHELHDAAYFAICNDASSSTHPAMWQGPLRTDKERAMSDANEHNKKYSHNAEITHY